MLKSVKHLMWTMAAVGSLAGSAAYSEEGASTALPPATAADRANFPPSDAHLRWTAEQKVIGHRNMHVMYPTRAIPAGGKVFPLPRGIDIAPTYKIDNVAYSLDDYFQRSKASGLLVIKKGRIVLERYGNGYTEQTAGTSRSMAKSMTSILVGAAIKDGYIKSLDEPVANYVPEMKGTMYGDILLRQVLSMLSGVPYVENADDAKSDVSLLIGCMDKNQKGCIVAFLKDLATRPDAKPKPPGSSFYYSTADSALMGVVVERATKMPLTEYMAKRVWQPFGMERDGYWNAESADGNTIGGSGFGASLRDYGRVGLFVMRGGVLPSGDKVLPDGWMAEAIKPSLASIEAKQPYGYYWWRPTYAQGEMQGSEGAYFARGSNGQAILVNPAEDVVIAKWGAVNSAEDNVLYAAIVNQLHGK